MSSVPDQASATQWMVTCSSRPRRPSAAQVCCESAAGSAAGLSGAVRPTNSFSGGGGRGGGGAAGPGGGAPAGGGPPGGGGGRRGGRGTGWGGAGPGWG